MPRAALLLPVLLVAACPAKKEGVSTLPPVVAAARGGACAPMTAERISAGRSTRFSGETAPLDATRGLQSGDQVRVCPGTYHIDQGIEISGVADVTIAGEQAEIVATRDLAVIRLKDVRNVTVSGLRLVHRLELAEGCTNNCIDIVGSVDVKVKGCDLEGSGYHGIFVERSAGLEVTGTAFHGCKYGFYADSGSERITLKGNRFYDNERDNLGDPAATYFTNDVRADNELR